MRHISLFTLLFAIACETNPSDKDDHTGEGGDDIGGGGDTLIDTDDTTDDTTDTDVVNRPPGFPTFAVVVEEDDTVLIDLSATDSDDDPLVYAITEQPTRGQLIGTAPNVVYQPDPDVFGEDDFEVEVFDGEHIVRARVPIQILPVNDPPRTQDASYTVVVGNDLSLELAGTDVDGDALSWTLTKMPELGSLAGSGSAFSYMPAATGTDTIEFEVSDGRLTHAGVVRLEVLPEPTPPVGSDRQYVLFGGMEHHIPAPEGILADAYDPGGTTVSVPPQTLTTSGGGSFEAHADGSFTYLAPHGPAGFLDSVQVEITDEQGDLSTVQVMVSMPRSVWFVDNTSNQGNGSRVAPFAALESAELASLPGDVIVLLPGDGTAVGTDAGLVMQPDQVLCGGGAACVVDAVHIEDATTPSPLTSLTGIMMADGTTVSGVHIEDGAGLFADDTIDATVQFLTARRPEGALIEAHDAVGLTIQELHVDEASEDAIVLVAPLDLTMDSLSFVQVLGTAITVREPRGDLSIDAFGIFDADTGIHIETWGGDGEVDIGGFTIRDTVEGVVVDGSVGGGGGVTLHHGLIDGTSQAVRVATGADSSIFIDIAHMTLEARDGVLSMTTADQSVLRATMLNSTFSGDGDTPMLVDLAVFDQSSMDFDSQHTTHRDGQVAVWGQAMHDGELRAVYALSSATVQQHALELQASEDATVHLTCHDNGFFDGDAVFLDASQTQGGGVYANLHDNNAVGSWTLISRYDGPHIWLAVPDAAASAFVDSDGDALIRQDNHSQGGDPHVIVQGVIAEVSETAVALP